MPGAVQPLSRGAILWPLRALLVAAVTFGLFVMHTLPGMAATPSMATDQAIRVPSPARGHVMAQGKTLTTHQLGRAEPAMGCSGDHATCMAVMQSSPTPSAMSARVTIDLTSDSDAASLVHAMAASSRAPPGVSLDKLCISRT